MSPITEKPVATIAGKITKTRDGGYKSENFVHDIPDGADPELHALLLVLNDEFDLDADDQSDVVMDALRLAKRNRYEVVAFKLGEADGTVRDFTVWSVIPKFGELVPDFGVSENGQSRWVEVRPYKPDEALRKRLEGFSKEQLIEILLRTHAASYISFPPSLNG